MVLMLYCFLFKSAVLDIHLGKLTNLLNQRDGLKAQIHRLIEQSEYLEETTLKGGIFAVFKVTEGDDENKPASARWIRQKSKFLLCVEDKLKDVELSKADSSGLCLQNINFENVLFQVQSGQLLDEEEIASQLLLFCINMLILNNENDASIQKLREVLLTIKKDFLQ
jgi:hypothetical protein